MQSSLTTSWATTICRCFAFERSAAALLLHNTAQAGPHAALKFAPSVPAVFHQSTAHQTDGKQSHQKDSVDPASKPQQGATYLHAAAEGSEFTVTAGASSLNSTVSASGAGPHLSSTGSRAPTGVVKSGPHASPEAQGINDAPISSTESTQRASAQAAARDQSSGPDTTAVLLPRMHLGLRYIAASTTYRAVASVARQLAASAQATDQNKDTFAGDAHWSTSCSEDFC